MKRIMTLLALTALMAHAVADPSTWSKYTDAACDLGHTTNDLDTTLHGNATAKRRHEAAHGTTWENLSRIINACKAAGHPPQSCSNLDSVWMACYSRASRDGIAKRSR